jgi:hypothetical protein
VNRRRYIERIEDALGGQKLIWVGTRGHDAIGLMDIAQFSEAYGIVAPLGSLSLAVDLALEQLTKKRVDLDTYRIDDDWSHEANEFRRRLLASLAEPACVVAYRSLALLSAISYPRSEFVTYLGMFHERQATFEHKPWVETELRKAGIPVLPWRYFADEDILRLEEEIKAQGVLVLRSNRSDGGAGLEAVRHPEDIRARISKKGDGFLAAAPLLDPHTPLNISGCVFASGNIGLHPPSFQLIGVEGCTRRRFGYCGNDFAAVKSLGPVLLRNLEEITLRTGRWLWSQGYLGAYGLDALIHEGNIFVTEINPRLQGSSAISARIDRESGRPDIYLSHISALLGLEPDNNKQSLSASVQEQPPYSQVILHNITSQPVNVEESSPMVPWCDLEIAPEATISVEPDAILLRVVFPSSVTRDGRHLDSDALCRLPKTHYAPVNFISQRAI